MKNFKSLKFLFTTLALVVAFAFSAFAGTAVIQFGDPKVTRDKVFNVACKVKSTDVRLKTADITVQYDPKMIEFMEGTDSEGGAGTVRINGKGVGASSGTRTLEYQLKFRALYAGTTNITILDQEVTDNTDNLVNITKLGSSKVTINPSNTQSKNANLATFEFSPGELDRAFDASVLSYNTEVNADVDRLEISAISEDKDARVVITGNENFKTGMNKVTIDVTAPDGKTKKQYVLNVTKFETGVTSGNTTIVNGQRFSSNAYTITIMMKPDDVPIPNGYKRLQYENGSESIEAYGPNNTPANETPEVFLVYGMNQNGDVDFYRYDSKNGEGTIQRYIPEPNAGNYEELANRYESLNEEHQVLSKRFAIIFPVTIILAALVIVLIIIMIVMIVKGGSGKKSNPYQMDDDDDDDDDDYFSSKPRKISSSNYDSSLSDDDNSFDEKKTEDDLDNDIVDLG